MSWFAVYRGGRLEEMKNNAETIQIGSSNNSLSSDSFNNSLDLNYTSVFSYFTNEVINECTPDKGFSTRIRIRLDAIKGVYGAFAAFVAAIDKTKRDSEIVFMDTEERIQSERFLGFDIDALEGVCENTPFYLGFEKRGGGLSLQQFKRNF